MQIELTEFVRQDSTKDPKEQGSAIAYLVFDCAGDARLFHEFAEAEEFAWEQLANCDDDGWDVFPLYAGRLITIDGETN